MALIRCTECGHEISDKAPVCPKCGCPVQQNADIYNQQTNLEPSSRNNKKMYVMVLTLGTLLLIPLLGGSYYFYQKNRSSELNSNLYEGKSIVGQNNNVSAGDTISKNYKFPQSRSEDVDCHIPKQLLDIEDQFSDTRLKELHRRTVKRCINVNSAWNDFSKLVSSEGKQMLLDYIFAADGVRFEEKNNNYECLYDQKEWEQVCTAMLEYYLKSSHRSLPTSHPARFRTVEKVIEDLAKKSESAYGFEYDYQYVESNEDDRKLNRYLCLWLTRDIYAKAPQSALAALQDEWNAWEKLRDCLLTTCADELTCTQWGGNTPAGSFYHNAVSQSQKKVDDFRKASIKRFSAIIGAGNFNEHAADQPTISNPQELLNTFKGYFADSDFEGDDWTINEVTENTKATIAAYEQFEVCQKRVEEALPENMRAAYAKETRAYLNLIDFE